MKLYLSAVILFIFSSAVFAQARTEPSCYNEQIAKDALLAELRRPDVMNGSAPPPGTLIMTGPFGDPKYSATGWEKRAYTQYSRESKPSQYNAPRMVQRYTVQLHFMWNNSTLQSDQVKFSTTTHQGCVGELVTAELIGGEDNGGGGPGREITIASPQFTWGLQLYRFVGTFTRTTGTVEVGPVVPLQWISSGTSFGGPPISGACPRPYSCLFSDL